MKTLLKITGAIITIIVVLIILGALAIHLFLTPSTAKNLAAKQVKQKTGRELSIGKLSWSFFPTLSLQAGDVSLSNAKGFGNQPFFILKHAEIGARLLPLLNKRLEATSITVNGLTLNLMENRQGETNWDDLTSQEKTKGQTTHANVTAKKDKVASKPNTPKTSALYFDIPLVDLKNININWINAKNGQHIQLNHMSFYARNLQNQKPFPFNIAINMTQNKPPTKINGQLKGQLSLSPNKNRYQLKNANLDSTITNKSGIKRIRINNMNATVDIKDNKISIAPISAILYHGKLKGNAIINLQSKAPAYALNATLSGISAQAMLVDLMQYNKLTGAGSISLNITTQGDDASALTRHLNGVGRFSFTNGTFKGIDIAFILRKAISLTNRKIKPIANQRLTKFGRLTGSFNIRNGNARNNFKLISPVIEIACKGYANLVNQALDYQCSATLVKGSLQHLTPIAPVIPFTIKGSFKNPKIQPNLKNLLQENIKQQLGKEIEKRLKGLPKLNLPGLFGR